MERPLRKGWCRQRARRIGEGSFAVNFGKVAAESGMATPPGAAAARTDALQDEAKL